MHASEPVKEKSKRVCEDFPNIAILTKSSKSGQIQLTSGHAAVGNNSLGESVVAFTLAGNLSLLSVIAFNIEIAFATDGKNLRLPNAEVFLHAASSDLARSRKQREWNPRNAILLPPFLTEAKILHGESDAGELLKISARSITSGCRSRIPQTRQTRLTTTIASSLLKPRKPQSKVR